MTQAQQEKLIQQYMKARDAYWESVQRVYEDRKKFIAAAVGTFPILTTLLNDPV